MQGCLNLIKAVFITAIIMGCVVAAPFIGMVILIGTCFGIILVILTANYDSEDED